MVPAGRRGVGGRGAGARGRAPRRRAHLERVQRAAAGRRRRAPARARTREPQVPIPCQLADCSFGMVPSAAPEQSQVADETPAVPAWSLPRWARRRHDMADLRRDVDYAPDRATRGDAVELTVVGVHRVEHPPSGDHAEPCPVRLEVVLVRVGDRVRRAGTRSGLRSSSTSRRGGRGSRRWGCREHRASSPHLTAARRGDGR